MTIHNYFALLRLSETVDDIRVIRESEAPALQYWQMMLTSATGNKLWEVREILSNNLLAEAVRVLSNDTLRQEHRQHLQYERSKPELPDGQVQVGFDVPEKGRDLTFKVIENPILRPLRLGGYTVNSPQELVYRLWLNPELYTTYLQGDQVALWLRYAGAEIYLSDLIRYIDWRYGYPHVEDAYHFTVDVLQACYPIPDLPRSAPYIFDKFHQVPSSEIRPYPKVLYLGMIPNEMRRYKIVLDRWQNLFDIGEAKTTSPYLQLDLTELKHGIIEVKVEGNTIPRGTLLNEQITIKPLKGDSMSVSVIGARYKMFDNQELEQRVEIEYAKQLQGNQLLGAAAERFYRAGDRDQAQIVTLQHLQQLYEYHRWPSVIEETKRFIRRFGDSVQLPQVYAIMVEASRYMAGTLMTLELKQRAHPYLVNLAVGSSKLEGKALSNDNWSMRPESQITLNPGDARRDWIMAAEAQNMRWTQPGGNAGKTHFVGDRVIALTNRYVAWRQTGIDYPVIAGHGVLVARTWRRDGIVGLDAASGELRWFHRAKENNGRIPLPEPVILDKRVFWCDLDGTLCGLDLETGDVLWLKTVENPVQLTLLAENDEVYLATGNKILIFAAKGGELIFESNELRSGMFGLGIFKSDNNPFNLILSDKWLGFQDSRNKATIANMESGNAITSHMPGSPLPWCVHEGVFFQAWVVAYYGRYQTSDGTREHRWEKLFIEAFHATDQSSNRFEFLLSGTAYKKSSFTGENSAYTETYRTINAISLAPVTVANNVLTHHTDRKNPHQLIAVAYEKRIIYLTYEKNHFKARGDRKLDSVVQALMYSNAYDIAVTRRHISTSFVGQTDEHTSQFELGYDSTLADSNTAWLRLFSDPKKVQLEGTPAVYGDIIYLTHNNGDLIALAP